MIYIGPCLILFGRPARRSCCRRSYWWTIHRFRSWQEGESVHETSKANHGKGVYQVRVSYLVFRFSNQDSSVCPEEGRLPDAKQGSFTAHHWHYLVLCCPITFHMIFWHVLALCKRNKGYNLAIGNLLCRRILLIYCK